MLLDKSAILVVEDEPFIALDLAATVMDAGGEVVGPAGSVQEALALLDACAVDGAILDVNLSGRDSCPVAERLIASGVPLIFHTSRGLPLEFSARFPNLIVHLKPLIAEVLVPQLARLIAAKSPR
jgi:CheY-like chemotaxis protein